MQAVNVGSSGVCIVDVDTGILVAVGLVLKVSYLSETVSRQTLFHPLLVYHSNHNNVPHTYFLYPPLPAEEILISFNLYLALSEQPCVWVEGIE
jgi:hypothetical protein